MLVHTTHSMKHAEGGPRQQRSKTKLLGNIPLTKATRYTTQEQTLAVVVFQSSHTNQGQSGKGPQARERARLQCCSCLHT